MKTYITILFTLFLIQTGCSLKTDRSHEEPYYVPGSISEQAQDVIRSFELMNKTQNPEADDLDSWKRFWEHNETRWLDFNDSVVRIFNPTITETLIGGTPVIDIKPEDWEDNGKVLIYTHGGAYVYFSARTMLMGSVPVADRLNIRVISVDYTTAPFAGSSQMLDQIISVVQALLKEGYDLDDIGMYGDSAGGALTSGAVLKMRDLGIGMPAGVVLISPWSDINEIGDSYVTLKDVDPILSFEKSLGPASLALAHPEEHKNPYISPVYADYSKGFPPTIIQGGTKEIFLSNFVRHYQALDQAGISVKLDLYEGMWHVFQEVNFDLPESILAHKKMEAFFRKHLDY